MFIQTETTPNPNTLKFLPGEPVFPNSTADFRDAAAAARSPLAARFFKLNGVAGVFYGHDFISITKADNVNWAVIKPMALGLIMDHFSQDLPLFNDGTNAGTQAAAQATLNENEDDTSKQIRELLDTRVRPAVAMDGGDIHFHSFANGVVYVQLQGACVGCPSSTLTLKAGIENMLRHYIPEVNEVRAI